MASTNTVGNFIKSVFPTIVNKNGEVFKALLANEYGSGTIEKIFNEFEAERKTWCKGFYDQTGEQLQKTLAVFSVLTQLQNESEEVFLKRNELLFYRNGDTVWGDRWNILNIFKTFFNNEHVYLVNNAEKYADSFLIDGNFENGDTWILDGCTYEREARFEETIGVLFNAAGTCSQTVVVEANKVYFLHFFLKGNIRVKIQDNNGRYWNSSIGDFGQWQASERLQSFESANKWDNKSLFFINDRDVQAVTITFVYESGCYAFLDFVRLCEKTRASMFSLIVVFESIYSDKTMGLAPGTNDPIESVNYDKVSYLDHTFIFGATGKAIEEVYKELLDIVKPGGVTSVIEILTREQGG